MPTLYIMVGVPGAGKTTYAKNKLAHAVYIGADALRFYIFSGKSGASVEFFCKITCSFNTDLLCI